MKRGGKHQRKEETRSRGEDQRKGIMDRRKRGEDERKGIKATDKGKGERAIKGNE